MTTLMPNKVQHYLNPELKRIGRGNYETRDGQFRIVRRGQLPGLVSVKGDFQIEPRPEWARRMLDCAGLDHSWAKKREAVEHLRGSVYAEPDGWAHADPEAVERAYVEALSQPVDPQA